MSSKIDFFEKNMDIETSGKIISDIQNSNWGNILNGLCSIKDDSIILDHIYVKYFATQVTYCVILNHITTCIDTILLENSNFNVHANLKNLTLADIDKHKEFIQNISIILKKKYTNKLTKCYIYNAPFVFSQILNIVSLFIDKETQTKIQLVQKK